MLDSNLYIRFVSLSQSANLKVYDIKGQLLKDLSVQDMEVSIDMSEYTPGIYFINIQDNTGVQQTKRFIKP